MPTSSIPKSKSKSKTQKPVLCADEKRLAKLEVIREKLEQGKHVQNRDLQTWLTRDEYELIDFYWEREQERRQLKYGEKPDEVKEYEEKLKKAKFFDSRADGFRKDLKKALKERYYAETLYERALEYLQEQYEKNPGIQTWFDRPIVIDKIENSNLAPNVECMPHVITSRSLINQSPVRKQTIADIKLTVVEQAIKNIKKPSASENANTGKSKKLEELLKLPEDDFGF